MVSTPQKIAEIDVTRAINLYKKFNIPVAGIIENMSYFVDPSSGQEIKIFAGNSSSKISKEHNIPILAKIAITPELSVACDSGNDLKEFVSLLPFNINSHI